MHTLINLAQPGATTAANQVDAAAISPVVPGALIIVLIGALLVAARIIKTVAAAAKAIIGPLLAAMAVLALIALVLIVVVFGDHGANKPTDPRVADVVSPAVVMGG